MLIQVIMAAIQAACALRIRGKMEVIGSTTYMMCTNIVLNNMLAKYGAGLSADSGQLFHGCRVSEAGPCNLFVQTGTVPDTTPDNHAALSWNQGRAVCRPYCRHDGIHPVDCDGISEFQKNNGRKKQGLSYVQH